VEPNEEPIDTSVDIFVRGSIFRKTRTGNSIDNIIV
jgi:hypothetical protein